MKFIWIVSVASVVLMATALFLPYTVLKGDRFISTVSGWENAVALFQVIFTAVLFSISSIFRNRITAVVAFSLCFGFSIYFIVLSYAIYPTYLPLNSAFSYGSGFYLAISSAFLCWLAHLMNVIRIYRIELNKESTL